MIRAIREKLKDWRNFKDEAKARNKFHYFVLEVVETMVVAVPIALLIRHYIIQTSVVPTGSMIPTLMVKDRLFVNKYIYRFTDPKRGEIVVFESPFGDDKEYVKRCVGVPGDLLEVKNGVVYIDGKVLVLPGVLVQADYSSQEPVKIPEGHYFMMGDNRGNSLDSRSWGFVTREHVKGRASFTFWPFSRMRFLK